MKIVEEQRNLYKMVCGPPTGESLHVDLLRQALSENPKKNPILFQQLLSAQIKSNKKWGKKKQTKNLASSKTENEGTNEVIMEYWKTITFWEMISFGWGNFFC